MRRTPTSGGVRKVAVESSGEWSGIGRTILLRRGGRGRRRRRRRRGRCRRRIRRRYTRCHRAFRRRIARPEPDRVARDLREPARSAEHDRAPLALREQLLVAFHVRRDVTAGARSDAGARQPQADAVGDASGGVVPAPIALDESTGFAVARTADVAAPSSRQLARGDGLAGLVLVFFARGARTADDALVRTVTARDDGSGAVAARVRSSGGTLLRRPARTHDETAGGLHLAARRAHGSAVDDAALVRVVLCAAHQSIAVTSRDDAGSLRAERGSASITCSAHAGRDLLARGRLGEALAERVGSGRIRLGEPPVDARSRLAEPSSVSVGTCRNARTRGRDLRECLRISRSRRSRRWLRGRFLTSTRDDEHAESGEARERGPRRLRAHNPSLLEAARDGPGCDSPRGAACQNARPERTSPD